METQQEVMQWQVLKIYSKEKQEHTKELKKKISRRDGKEKGESSTILIYDAFIG